VFTKDLIQFFRDLLVAKFIDTRDKVLDVSEDEMEVLKKLTSEVTEEHLTLVLSELIKAESDVRYSFSPRVALEMALIKISYLSVFRTVNEAIAAISGSSIAEEPVSIESGSQPAPSAKKFPSKTLKKKVAGPAPQAVEEPAPPPVTEESPAEVEPPAEPEPSPAQVAEPVGVDAEDDYDEDIPLDEEMSVNAPAPFTGPSLLHAIVGRMHDPRKSSRLNQAVASLEGGTLSLTFKSADAGLCAQPFKDEPEEVEKLATELMGIPMKIEIHIQQGKDATCAQPLKEQAKKEPLVQDALDLFEGRVVNVKPIEEK
jgi:DNA polymerase-3 subunit gamma/tau